MIDYLQGLKNILGLNQEQVQEQQYQPSYTEQLTQQSQQPEQTVTNSLLNYLGYSTPNQQTQGVPYAQNSSQNGSGFDLSSLLARSTSQTPIAPQSANLGQQSPLVDYSSGSGKNNFSGSALDQATAMIKKHEGFRAGTYWDVNAYRLGYGTDTITNPDGTVRRVKKGDTVTKEQAELDLKRRTNDFMSGVSKTIGVDAFNRLPDSAKASLTSVAYNYGSLNKLPSVIKAARSGNLIQLSQAIQNLGSHNKGVNRKRRIEEAQYFLRG